MCVPDELTLRLDLPVREGAAPVNPRHGAAITAVLEKAPRPAGIEARIALQDGVMALAAAGGPLAGRDPGPTYFFPFEGGVIDHPADQTGVWGPQGLALPRGISRTTISSAASSTLVDCCVHRDADQLLRCCRTRNWPTLDRFFSASVCRPPT